MKTSVYVDGFNLYYGALKGTPYKWLDLRRLCSLMLPHNDVQVIKYFTARVSARAGDPGQPMRQQTYLRALGTLPNLDIVYGHFLSHPCRMPLANPPVKGSRFVEVLKTEEKGSDVNLASHLLHDAHLGRFDVAVLITNYSDLVEPIRLIRNDLHLPVGVLNPHRKAAHEIAKEATFIKAIRDGVLANSQFLDEVEDERGIFSRPEGW